MNFYEVFETNKTYLINLKDGSHAIWPKSHCCLHCCGAGAGRSWDFLIEAGVKVRFRLPAHLR